MKLTDWKISRRLVFRITLPLVFIILVMAISLYVFNLRLISQFASGQIEISLSALSHEIYQICDRNFTGLLERGSVNDEQSIRISKAATLGMIEDFMRNNGIHGQIFDDQDAELLPGKIPAVLLRKFASDQNPSGIFMIEHAGEKYYATQISFKPWNWQIFIFKSAANFSSLIEQVRNVYIITVVSLLLAAMMLLYHLHKAVKLPVMTIIDDLRTGKNPEYKGISEFEFLSDHIREMMVAREESEQTIRNITAGLGEGVYVLDASGCLQFMNPEAERLLGWQESELLGKYVHDIFHNHQPDKEILPGNECPVLNLIRSGNTYRTEDDYFSRKDGSLLPVSYVATPLKKDGQIVGTVTAFQDNRERQGAEEALRESHQRLSEIFDFLPDATFAINLQGRVIAWNRAIEEMTGVKAESIVGKGDYQYALPFYGIRRPLLIDLVLTPDAVIEKEYIFVKREGDILLAEADVPVGGEIRHLWAKARASYNSQGSIIGAIESIRDLTVRKQAEDTFNSLISSAPIGIFIVQHGKFKLVNPGFQEITGYREHELLGTDSMDLVAPDYRKKVRRNAVRKLRERSFTPYEYRIITKDGEIRWIMETVTSIQYLEERATLGYFLDITERKQLEKQFLHSQRMEAVGRLAGGLAHDFSNIVGVIIWSVQGMINKVDKDSPHYPHLVEIKNSAERAILLTRRLLAFSRKQVLQPQIIDLNSVITDMGNMMMRLVGEDVSLITVLDPALKAVMADPARIEQVIMNLLVNARDAMPEGGKLTIETGNIFLDQDYTNKHLDIVPGPYVMLAVSDNGLGMDPVTQAHIFEPFYTTKEADEGTGLGLSTVYGIVKQSGGHIEVYSEPGMGTTLKIYLPQVEEGVAAAKTGISAALQLQGSETILLVEDEELLLNLISDALKAHGYTVLPARQGSDALLLAEQHPGSIHLMLTDMVMPEMTGRELAERLASSHPKLKVLYMSGYTEKAAIHRKALDKKAPFIEKPFTPAALLRKLRQILDAPSGQ